VAAARAAQARGLGRPLGLGIGIGLALSPSLSLSPPSTLSPLSLAAPAAARSAPWASGAFLHADEPALAQAAQLLDELEAWASSAAARARA
jgi:hypothetical protein